MALRIPLGISDFREIRQEGLTYVDKSLLIRDIIDDTSKVLLLPRPRRFGKTLNLSMLRCFFSRTDDDAWPLFADLAIARAGERYRAHCGRYPVLFMTFKDIKPDRWEDCLPRLSARLAELYQEHSAILPVLAGPEAATFTAILEQRATQAQLADALRNLTIYLHRHHGERVMVLLDEYDTPLHTAYLKGYYDPAVSFFRDLYSGVLKDNDVALYKGVLTGILRVAKDSIFTGLNNLDVYSLLRPEYAGYFGFTEPEVTDLLAQAGRLDQLSAVQRWYNGYVFGKDQVIYNPWSVLAYLKGSQLEPVPYWAETSSNDLVRELLVQQGLGFSIDMEVLLRGETIDKEVAEQVALRELRDAPDLLWSFLLMTGYLKVVRRWLEEGRLFCSLAIPNLEVRTIYQGLFRVWLSRGLGEERLRQELIRALLGGDAITCQRLLQHWLVQSASFFDTAAHAPPERFYHGFVLGLLVSMGQRYEVRSNAESGYGRCDVLLLPLEAGQPGVALELKVRDEDETVEHALEAALRQLRERDYAQRLRDRGAAPVQELAFVFDGKRVHGRRRA